MKGLHKDRAKKVREKHAEDVHHLLEAAKDLKPGERFTLGLNKE